MVEEVAVSVGSVPERATSARPTGHAHWRTRAFFGMACAVAALNDGCVTVLIWLFATSLLPALYTITAVFLALRTLLVCCVALAERHPWDVFPQRTLHASMNATPADYLRQAVNEFLMFFTLPYGHGLLSWYVVAVVYVPPTGWALAVAFEVLVYSVSTATYSIAVSILINVAIMVGLLCLSLCNYIIVIYAGIVVPRDMAKESHTKA